MMVNCPKCEFAQPKDQYCAKCGVDMIAYRPAEKPLAVRILGNTVFQLFLLVGLIAVGFGYVKYENQTHLATRIAELEDTESTQLMERPLVQSDSASQGAVPMSDESAEVIEEASTRPDAAIAPAAASAPAALAGSNQLQANQIAQGDAEARSLIAQNAAKPTNDGKDLGGGGPAVGGEERSTAPTNVRFVFAEIQKPFLSELIASAQEGGGYGSYNSGVIPNFEAQLKAASGAIRNLEGDTSQPLRFNQMIPIYKGTIDESIDESVGQNIGLTLEITPFPSPPDDLNTRLSIRARRMFRDPRSAPPIDQLVFPEGQFSVPRGSAVFLSGLLPKRQLQDDESRLYNTVNILKILSLDSYKNGLSEFIVFIEPK